MAEESYSSENWSTFLFWTFLLIGLAFLVMNILMMVEIAQIKISNTPPNTDPKSSLKLLVGLMIGINFIIVLLPVAWSYKNGRPGKLNQWFLFVMTVILFGMNFVFYISAFSIYESLKDSNNFVDNGNFMWYLGMSSLSGVVLFGSYLTLFFVWRYYHDPTNYAIREAKALANLYNNATAKAEKCNMTCSSDKNITLKNANYYERYEDMMKVPEAEKIFRELAQKGANSTADALKKEALIEESKKEGKKVKIDEPKDKGIIKNIGEKVGLVSKTSDSDINCTTYSKVYDKYKNATYPPGVKITDDILKTLTKKTIEHYDPALYTDLKFYDCDKSLDIENNIRSSDFKCDPTFLASLEENYKETGRKLNKNDITNLNYNKLKRACGDNTYKKIINNYFDNSVREENYEQDNIRNNKINDALAPLRDSKTGDNYKTCLVNNISQENPIDFCQNKILKDIIARTKEENQKSKKKIDITVDKPKFDKPIKTQINKPKENIELNEFTPIVKSKPRDENFDPLSNKRINIKPTNENIYEGLA